jgi:hypothetical protein
MISVINIQKNIYTLLRVEPPVRIQVRIGPPYPLCIVLNGVTAPCHNTKKYPPCSMALSAEHRPKFCNPLPGNGDVSI